MNCSSSLLLTGFASLDVIEHTSYLEFHASKLTLSSIKLVASSSLEKPLSPDVSVDEKSERASLKFADTLTAGTQAQLHIVFEGEITGAMLGYYRSSWTHDGQIMYYSLTQFEVRAVGRDCLVSTDPSLSPPPRDERFLAGMSLR